MPYEHMPDPRPANVRLALGNLSRRAAWGACAVWAAAAGVAWTFAWFDRSHLALWGAAGLGAAILAGNYMVAIRWANLHGGWPHRRSSRRQAPKGRVMDPTESKP
jgi:hypothetical protein